MDIKKLTAPCGLACFACGVYKDNITDELARQTAKMLGMEAKDVPCDGCRSERVKQIRSNTGRSQEAQAGRWADVFLFGILFLP
ncbi:MAG: DUF3795 domain-containing protein [Desulfobacterales bacterium]|nr:DUF3795 domain-containing protein [Desulfobacterales bacterium]